MEMKEEPHQYEPLYGFGKHWEKKWEQEGIEENVSINDESIQLINKARELLSNHVDEFGIVKRSHPLAGIDLIQGLRFVQLHLPPNENDSTWKVRLAIGLDARVSEEDKERFIEFFGKNYVCKAPSKRAPGVVHKVLMGILINLGEISSRTSVLGSSFYLNDLGEIEAINRSGQNVGYTQVNDLGRLCMLKHKEPLVDRFPIRISQQFSIAEIEKALNGESVLLQKADNKYYVHYLHAQKLTCAEIEDKEILNCLSDIQFPKNFSDDLTGSFVKLEGNDRDIEENFNKIRDHLVEKTHKKNLSKIPSFDTPFFLQGGRNIHKKLFEPLHKGTIKAINSHTKLEGKVTDITSLDGLNSVIREGIWELIISHKNTKERDELVKLMLYKTLLYISAEDLKTRGENYEDDFENGFLQGLDFLNNKMDIFAKRLLPNEISEQIANQCDKVNKYIGEHEIKDGLSIDQALPVWLSLYITALRNRNEIILGILQNKLVENDAYDEQVTNTLIEGFQYAHKTNNIILYNRLKEIEYKLHPNAYNKYNNWIKNSPQPKYKHILHKISKGLLYMPGTALTQESFEFLYQKGHRDFSETILTSIDFSKIKVENVNFNYAELSSKQIVDLYNQGSNNISGLTLRGINLSQENFLSLCNNGHREFSGAILPSIDFSDITVNNNISFKDVQLSAKQVMDLYKGGFRNFKGAILEDIDLSKQILSGCDFSEANLKGANLSEATLEKVNLNRCDLEKVNLNNAIIKDSKMVLCRLPKANLEDIQIVNTDVRRATFRSSNLTNAKFEDLNGLDKTSFILVKLTSKQFHALYKQGLKKFTYITLDDIDLSGQDIKDCDFSASSLKNVKLKETKFSNIHFNGTTFENVTISTDLFEQFLSRYTRDIPDLTGSDLSEVEPNKLIKFLHKHKGKIPLKGVKFTQEQVASLSQLKLKTLLEFLRNCERNTPLYGIKFNPKHKFDKIDLSGRVFQNCDFSRISLKKAKLNGTVFVDTNFSYTKFDGCDLTKIEIKSCPKGAFKGATFAKAKIGTNLFEQFISCDSNELPDLTRCDLRLVEQKKLIEFFRKHTVKIPLEKVTFTPEQVEALKIFPEFTGSNLKNVKNKQKHHRKKRAHRSQQRSIYFYQPKPSNKITIKAHFNSDKNLIINLSEIINYAQLEKTIKENVGKMLGNEYECGMLTITDDEKNSIQNENDMKILLEKFQKGRDITLDVLVETKRLGLGLGTKQ